MVYIDICLRILICDGYVKVRHIMGYFVLTHFNILLDSNVLACDACGETFDKAV